MNYQNNLSKEISLRYQGAQDQQKFNHNNLLNQKLDSVKISPYQQDISEQFYEESDQNQNEENPMTELEDTSFEENNASFLKTFKYKKQSNVHQNENMQSSEEFDSDQQNGQSTSSQQYDQSHMMSNYIDQLKKERNQIGYKSKFEKKKISNNSQNSFNNQQNQINQKINEKNTQNQDKFKEDQTFFNDNKQQNNNTIQIQNSKSNQIGTLYMNSAKNKSLKKNDNHSQLILSQNKTDGQISFDKQNNYQQGNHKYAQRNIHNQQQINEEKSDECKSSSSSANENSQMQRYQQISHHPSQQENLQKNINSYEEDNYFTLKDNSNLINSVDSNQQKNINQTNEHLQKIHTSLLTSTIQNLDSQKNNFYKQNQFQNDNSSLNLNQNFVFELQKNQNASNHYNGDQLKANVINQQYQNLSNGKLTKSKSQIQLTNNNNIPQEIQDKNYEIKDKDNNLQSPLSQLNLFKHSAKSNKKQNSQNQDITNGDIKNTKNIQQFQDTKNKFNEKSQSKQQISNNENIVSYQNIDFKQQNTQTYESLFGNLSNFQMDFFQKVQCAKVQQYDQICENENKFYQERKKSLELKYEQLSKQNNKQMQGDNYQLIQKEDCLQIIAERLMLELRMANKVISFLECQNKYFQNKIEDISLSTMADEKKNLRLSQFICNNCQSTSFFEKDDNLTFIKNAKISQLSSNQSNQNFSQTEQNQYMINNNISHSNLSLQKINNLDNSKQSQQQSYQQDSSLHDDFKNIVNDFNNLKKLSINMQKQIEFFQKENQLLNQQNAQLHENIKQQDIVIKQMVFQHEQDKKNLIQEINILTKENCDLRDNFQEQIKQIKLHEAQEFHNLEEKVRQTIQKKDDCIQKLNQVIIELRSK